MSSQRETKVSWNLKGPRKAVSPEKVSTFPCLKAFVGIRRRAEEEAMVEPSLPNSAYQPVRAEGDVAVIGRSD